MQTRFSELADHIGTCLQGAEAFTATYDAEDSDFVRFNQGKVRQAGHVTQQELDLDLIDGAKHVSANISLAGDAALDKGRVARLVKTLRERLAGIPDDPYLLYATEPVSSEQIEESTLPDSGEAVAEIQAAADGKDLVGVYAAGGIHKGFANSFGQRNWYATHSYNLDWSFFLRADKAVKSSYAGFTWDKDAFQRKVDLGAGSSTPWRPSPARSIRAATACISRRPRSTT
jgi:predicted Zn-dependent protease